MDENVLFSVIIPFYNPLMKYFENCIHSLVNQNTNKLFEVILVNDGTLGLDEYCKDLVRQNQNFKYLYQKNAGVSAARNNGINIASGKYILFLDSDDTYEFDTIEKLSVCAEEKPDLIMFNFKKIVNDKIYLADSYHRKGKFISDPEFVKDLCKTPELNLSTNKAFLREILTKKNIRFNESLCMAEDVEFVLRFLPEVSTVYNVSEAFYNYYINNNSASQKYDKDTAMKYLNSMNEIFYHRDHLSMKTIYPIFINHFIFSLMKDIFHPLGYNKRTYKEKLQFFLHQECYSQALECFDSKDFGIIKNLLIFCIRHRYYGVIRSISYLNFKRKQ